MELLWIWNYFGNYLAMAVHSIIILNLSLWRQKLKNTALLYFEMLFSVPDDKRIFLLQAMRPATSTYSRFTKFKLWQSATLRDSILTKLTWICFVLEKSRFVISKTDVSFTMKLQDWTWTNRKQRQLQIFCEFLQRSLIHLFISLSTIRNFWT